MKSLKTRTGAATAAVAAAGALCIPLAFAPSASAAAPTGITVNPVSQTVPAGTSATITATLTGTNLSNLNGVYFRVTAGPDSTTGNTGQQCAAGAGSSYTCTIPTTTDATHPGTDSVQVFYDAQNVGAFQAGDQSANATVIFAGQATKTTITPASANRATGSAAAYTISGTDSNGNPASGSVDVTISQTSGFGSDPLRFADPKGTSFPAAATGTPTSSSSGSGANTTYSDTEKFAFKGGSTSIGVASLAPGSVAISAGKNSVSFSAGTAALTVSAGNTSGVGSVSNDDRAAGLSLAAGTTSFINHTITDQVTVTNAAGDALGGVTVQGAVIGGPNKNAPVAVTGTTDQFGHATLSYPAGATAGTDSLQAWVNQDTHSTNTGAADPGEPQATTSIALVNEPAGLTLTSDKDSGVSLPTTQPSTTVTYTLKDNKNNPASGFTLKFAIDSASTPANNAFTVTPSGVTDANGQVTVTVTDPAPASGDKIVVDAALQGDEAAVKDNSVTVSYSPATATTLSLSPAAQTQPAGAQVTETAKLVDQFSQPISGQTVAWQVQTGSRNSAANNSQAKGTCTTDGTGSCSFSYTDAGPAVTLATQSTQVDFIQASAGSITSNTAKVQFVASNGNTAALALAANATSAGTTANPTSAKPSSAVVPITAKPTDSNGTALLNKTVTFNSTGVGTFADSQGNPIGTSASAQTNANGEATVYVRSTTTGTQTITASSDGVGSNPASVSVSYTSDYVSIAPERVLDTRTGQGSLTTVNGGAAPAKLAPNTNYVFSLGATDLPTGQAAYAFNVTAIGASGLGNLRIGPGCGFFGNGSTPSTSLINYQPGKDVANFVVLPNSGCDQFVIYSDSASVSVAIDAVGYYPSASSITAGTPTRIVDTRTGVGGSTGAITGGTSRSFQVSAPAGTKAVALNVTAISPSALGNMRIYPDGATVPNASNINYIPGVDKAAFVVVNLPTDGKIDVYSDGGSANVAMDLFATYPAASTLVTASPVRVLDTRQSANTLKSDTSLTFQVTGKAGVPADAQAVLVSVTGIHATGSTGVGNLRLYPAGGSLPTVSTLNYVSSTSDVANFAIVRLGTNGQLTLYSNGSPIDVAVDVLGYVPAGS